MRVNERQTAPNAATLLGIAALATIALTAACDDEAETLIDVVVSQESPGLPSPLDTIEMSVSVVGASDETFVRMESTPARYEDGRLVPWSVRVRPMSRTHVGRQLYRFRVTGRSAGRAVVSTQHRMVFVAATRLVLPVRFQSSCAERSCAADETCVAAACIDDLAAACAAVGGLPSDICSRAGTDAGDEGRADASTDAGPSCVPGTGGCRTIARIDTSMGTIRVELDAEHAPGTVANYVQYAQDGFYDGTIFHRVIDDFVIQGGGYEPGLRLKDTRAPIALEIDASLRHVDGAIAMARTAERNSATAQFYLCDGSQPMLDGEYAVFGVTIEGIDVVRTIASVEVSSTTMQPITDVVIRRVRVE